MEKIIPLEGWVLVKTFEQQSPAGIVLVGDEVPSTEGQILEVGACSGMLTKGERIIFSNSYNTKKVLCNGEPLHLVKFGDVVAKRLEIS